MIILTLILIKHNCNEFLYFNILRRIQSRKVQVKVFLQYFLPFRPLVKWFLIAKFNFFFKFYSHNIKDNAF